MRPRENRSDLPAHLFARFRHSYTNHRFAAGFDPGAHRNNKIGVEAEAKIVRLAGNGFAENRVRRIFKTHEDFGGGHRQALSGPDVKRHACPTPIVHIKANGRERFDMRIWRYAGLPAIAVELTSHDTAGLQWPYRPYAANLLVPNAHRVARSWRIHRQEHHDLQQMVLHNVADGAHLLVEFPPAPNAELFRHGNLHALDLLIVPDGLEKGIGEAKIEEVLNRLLA